MSDCLESNLVSLDTTDPIWNRFFMVAPLVLVGTREDDGAYDLAPKHMAMPLGWQNYFAFVCTPRHGTYGNVKRTKSFCVSFPTPSQLLITSLAAAPRCDDGNKTALGALGTFPATVVDGELLDDGYLYLECELERIIDGFGENSLIIGRIVAAHVREQALRGAEYDDHDLLRRMPVLAYLQPGRFTTITESNAFPFPEGMKR